MTRHLLLRALIVVLIGVSTTLGADRWLLELPKGYVVPQETQSPDKRYGVAVFDNTTREEPSGDGGRNKLIDLKTREVIAVLDGDSAMTRMNHGGIMPTRWSPDSSAFLWEVDGKWFREGLVLARLKEGHLLWQRNVLRLAQQEILARTRKVEPKIYAKVKASHAGWGSAYPDGFPVSVEVVGAIEFPVRVHATLTSETKFPSILDSHLEGEINAKGEWKVTKFGMGPGDSQ